MNEEWRHRRVAQFRVILGEVEDDIRKEEDRLRELRAVAKYLRKVIELPTTAGKEKP